MEEKQKIDGKPEDSKASFWDEFRGATKKRQEEKEKKKKKTAAQRAIEVFNSLNPYNTGKGEE